MFKTSVTCDQCCNCYEYILSPPLPIVHALSLLFAPHWALLYGDFHAAVSGSSAELEVTDVMSVRSALNSAYGSQQFEDGHSEIDKRLYLIKYGCVCVCMCTV